jgi:hypothetical protein
MNEGARARSLLGDLSQFEEALETAARDLQQKLRDTVEDQPVLAVGAAAGVGFLLGGGLSRGALTLLLGVGTRMAGAWLQREFLESADAQENEQ